MRFKCFGDLDAPDWILAEISVLSKISSVRMKLIVSQVIASLRGTAMDYAKIAKLTSDAGFEPSEIKAAVAALEHILKSAAKYDCDAGKLESELQQLGLPKEHSSSLCRPYREQQSALRESLASNTLRLPGLDSVRWRVDATVGLSSCQGAQSRSAQFLVGTNGEQIAIEVGEDKVRALHQDLLAAKAFFDAAKAK